MTLRASGQMAIPIVFFLSHVANADVELQVKSLGKLPSGLTRHDEETGTDKKWAKVREVLGDSADRVVIRQLGGSLGGNERVQSAKRLERCEWLCSFPSCVVRCLQTIVSSAIINVPVASMRGTRQ